MAQQVIEAIIAARRIFVVGQGSAALAQALGLSLRASGLRAEWLTADPLSLAMLISELNGASLVIAISLTEQVELANLLSYARDRGARTLALIVFVGIAVCACAGCTDLWPERRGKAAGANPYRGHHRRCDAHCGQTPGHARHYADGRHPRSAAAHRQHAMGERFGA